MRRKTSALSLFGNTLKRRTMTRKSFAFSIALSAMLLSPWSASAQMTDAERILGSWELSAIEDSTGDRSEDLDLYVFNLTFYALEDDTLKVDFLIATADDDAQDREPSSGTYEIDQDTDSLSVSLLGVFNIPAAYTFESDTTMTLSLDSGVMNAAMALIPLFVQGFVAPEPYAGTLLYTFTRVVEDVTSVDRADELPETSTLSQNYPNPFNPSTEIVYYLDDSGPVRLEVFDMAGKRIATLVEAVLPQGEHRARFDAGGLPTGTYVYRLTIGSGAKTLTKTMTLVR